MLPMQVNWKPLRAAMGSGLFAALVFITVSLVLRVLFGIGTLPELLSDRTAVMFSLPIFFRLIGLFGYALLKQIGITSILASELAGGVVFGLLYSWLLGRAPAKARVRVTGLAVLGYLGLVVFLWGNLRTNYLGHPPSTARLLSLLDLAVCAAAFVWALFVSYGLLTAPAAKEQAGRRALLLGGGSVALAMVSGSLLSYFYRIATYTYDGTTNAGDDLPAVTPNERYYGVTKNNVDPMPKANNWALEVFGEVQKPLKLTLAAISAMPSFDQVTTLQCISNPVGGDLSSNAVWTGTPLKRILDMAGMSAKTVQIMMYGADGFVDDLPLDAALHPYTIVAHKMNGVTIPSRHGYPVRLIVPGYVGEKSVKWLTGLEVREHEGKGFYEKQGWGPHFAIENTSRFDAPDDGSDVKVGEPVDLHGEAYCGDRGVRAVQLSFDDGGSWQTAEITYPGTQITWVQWKFAWTPKQAGDINIRVRSVDRRGGIQSDAAHGPGPGQSGGQQAINLTAKA